MPQGCKKIQSIMCGLSKGIIYNEKTGFISWIYKKQRKGKQNKNKAEQGCALPDSEEID